ncbi:hypothetical protein A2791_00890 [Candidatus Saccharibacteria bacterium RIFCSPHIGHO2_01_FULL_46_30]|nr:MAG: hypothetical protein A2791_00890 [Candidatus Saccharibacteria bacterium RIFCSPHIGHO2_01_FULL_46_30]
MLKAIDDFLNKTTMYRLLIYYLGGLLAVAVVVGSFGDLGFGSMSLIASTAILLAACWTINRGFAYIFKTPVNHESSIITALILALIVTPRLGLYDVMFLLAASGLAMASKYILTIKNVHIFNPAAIAVVITALGPQQDASWWIGTGVMVPFVVAGGVMVVRKIRREHMVYSFIAVSFVTTAFLTWLNHGNVMTSIVQTALTSPVFFLAFVMLTEPLTSPSTKHKQVWYGVLVGLLVPPQVHLARFYTSPELALVIGNIFSAIISPRVRVLPVLVQKLRIAANSVDFVFRIDKQLAYRPGQYMEWTLPHSHIDNRGNRRYFTLASSPTEQTLRLGVKFYDPSSSYKHALIDMAQTTDIVATQVSGDFVLPRSSKTKLVFIAGGIGVTPFRSMVKYLLDSHEQRDVVMLYAANTTQDIAYKDIFDQAQQELGMATTYVVAELGATQSIQPNFRTGRVDVDAISALVPEYRGRTYYISGSHQMVVAVQAALAQLGVPKRHIKVDYFPGYM